MNDGTRSRWPALLTLAFMLVLAGGSFWLLKRSEPSANGTPANARRGLPDYTMHDFRYVSVAPDGKISYLVEGERLDHFPDSDDSTIREPRLTRYAADRPPMTLRSVSARINGDHSEIHLHDQVLLRRPQANDASELTVNSDYMLVLTTKDVVTSDRPVQGHQGTSSLKGIGMVADNAQRTLKLQSQVSATFYQPPRAKP
jgi:lipopolysaccharide export system protein LptC